MKANAAKSNDKEAHAAAKLVEEFLLAGKKVQYAAVRAPVRSASKLPVLRDMVVENFSIRG